MAAPVCRSRSPPRVSVAQLAGVGAALVGAHLRFDHAGARRASATGGSTTPGSCCTGFERAWRATNERKYFDYIKRTVDPLIDADGKHQGLRAREVQHRQRSTWARCCSRCSPRPTDAKDKDRYTQGARDAARADASAAAHHRERLLAQGDLPAPDVARRRVHGVAVPGEVRAWSSTSRHSSTRWPSRSCSPRSTLRDPDDRPALPRLGREPRAALGQSEDRDSSQFWGRGDGLVRDGVGRRAGADAPRSSQARGGAGRSATSRVRR